MYNIIEGTNEELTKIASGLGLTYDEMVMLRNYFRGLGRNPTDIEIQAIAQGWSEHSCYKSSKLYLKKYFSGLKSDYKYSQWRMMQVSYHLTATMHM